MGRWETRHGNKFTASGPYTASSAATQPVQEQFALFAVVHPRARAHLLELSKVLCCSDLAKGKSLSNLNCQETSTILLLLGQGVSIRG